MLVGMTRYLSCPDCRKVSELTSKRGRAWCPVCGGQRGLISWTRPEGWTPDGKPACECPEPSPMTTGLLPIDAWRRCATCTRLIEP